MKVHGVVSGHRIMTGNGIRNFTMDTDSLFQQHILCNLDKQWDGTVDNREKTWNYHILAAHGDGGVKFNIFLGMIFTAAKQILHLLAKGLYFVNIMFCCPEGCSCCNWRLQQKTDFQQILC